MISSRLKLALLLLALLLLVGAMFWNLRLNKSGVAAKLARRLNETYGYRLNASDLFPAADWKDISIGDLLSELDLPLVLEASKAGGFPSDIERRGNVTLIMAHISNNDVITLYMVGEDIEVAFIQEAGTDHISPLLPLQEPPLS